MTFTQIQRIPMPNGGTPRRIVRVAGVIDFFMPPVSRFENGSGPDRHPYEIIFGAREGST